MATSSIFDNIRINNPQVLENFVAAMELSANSPYKKNAHSQFKVTTDPDIIRVLVEKGLKNRDNK